MTCHNCRRPELSHQLSPYSRESYHRYTRTYLHLCLPHILTVSVSMEKSFWLEVMLSRSSSSRVLCRRMMAAVTRSSRGVTTTTTTSRRRRRRAPAWLYAAATTAVWSSSTSSTSSLVRPYSCHGFSAVPILVPTAARMRRLPESGQQHPQRTKSFSLLRLCSTTSSSSNENNHHPPTLQEMDMTRDAISMVQHAIDAVSPYTAIQNHVQMVAGSGADDDSSSNTLHIRQSASTRQNNNNDADRKSVV